MLLLNLRRVFALRGITNPYTTLVKLGISRPTAGNLLYNNTTTIKARHMEKICELLRCEPNDLYEWKPSFGTADEHDHPLKGLRREGNARELAEMMARIPLDKIDQIKEILSGIENADQTQHI